MDKLCAFLSSSVDYPLYYINYYGKNCFVTHQIANCGTSQQHLFSRSDVWLHVFCHHASVNTSNPNVYCLEEGTSPFSVPFYLIPQYKTWEPPIISRELAYTNEIEIVLHRQEEKTESGSYKCL